MIIASNAIYIDLYQIIYVLSNRLKFYEFNALIYLQSTKLIFIHKSLLKIMLIIHV